MNNFDLVPFPEELKTLFILESPHTKEINYGYPAAGNSGEKMSRVILDDNTAFGKLLFDKNRKVCQYGIFNSCQFPLGLPELLDRDQKVIAKIKSFDSQRVFCREQKYDNLRNFLNSIEDLDSKISYTNRLKAIIQNSPNLETLVVCGFIAQAIFIKLCKIEEIPTYNKVHKIRTKNVLFVNHPRNGNWDYSKSKLTDF
jgi:uracil-DNA glycosylase